MPFMPGAAMALAAVLLSGAPALAQSSVFCNGRMAIDEFIVTPQNQWFCSYSIRFTGRPPVRGSVIGTITIENFPANMNVPRRSFDVSSTGGSATTMIGSGGNTTLNAQTVSRVVDNAGAAGPTVRVSNCRVTGGRNLS